VPAVLNANAGKPFCRPSAPLRRSGDWAQTPAFPLWAMSAFGSLWVGLHGSNTVWRIDPVSGRRIACIPVELGPASITSDANGMWVTEQEGTGLAYIDAATNHVTYELQGLGHPWYQVASAPGGIWYTTLARVVRVDPATRRFVSATPLPGGSEAGVGGGVVAADGAIWASANDTLFRIDQATGKIAGRYHVPGQPDPLLYAYGSIWLSSFTDNHLTRFDPASNRITATIPVPEDSETPALQLVGARGLLWDVSAGRPEIIGVDPSTNRIVKRIRIGSCGSDGKCASPVGVAYAGGSFWVTDQYLNRLWRITPP
jgi:DNA-binding beta-propeller fold protein YncE